MKVRNTRAFEGKPSGLVIWVDTQAQLPGLAEELDDVVFVEDLSQLKMTKSVSRLIMVERSSAELQEVVSAVLLANRPQEISVECWYLRDHSQEVATSLALIEGASINGVNFSDSWLKVKLVAANDSDRSFEDFQRGLAVARSAPIAGANSSVSRVPSRSAKGELIAFLIRIAKPIKPYLPAQLVVILYKMLGKIR